MKLSCNIVQDLLPGYVDGCTSQETNKSVEEHLTECQQCSSICEAMKEPLAEGADKEIDYLRRIRKSGYKKVLAAVVITFSLLLGIFLLFYYGTGWLTDAVMTQNVIVEDGCVTARASLFSPSRSFAGYQLVKRKDGNQEVNFKEAAKSFFHPSKEIEIEIPLEKIEGYLFLGDRVITQEGLIYDRVYFDLTDARIPFVGDAPGVGNLLMLAGFTEMGAYRIGLNTNTQPYSIDVFYEEEVFLEEGQKDKLCLRAKEVLACIDNCDVMKVWVEGSNFRVEQTEKAYSYDEMVQLFAPEEME